MTKIKTCSLWVFLLLGIASWSNLQAQCPNCTVSLPTMPVDTVYLDTFPNARQNEPYQENISFRLPMTTTPLIGLDTTQNIPAGISLTGFTVQGISGLPLGMSFILDRPLPALYNSSAPTPRDGCVTICGTPRQAGLFIVNISVLVETGVLAPQPATIPLEFLVLPDTSAGFTITNGAGCAPLTVSFTNNVSPDTSVGQSATYNWNFGNGQTSTVANPAAVVYSDSGTYTVDYQAIVTTTINQVFLNSITVNGTGCSDLFNAVDLFISVTGSQSGTDTVTTFISNTATPITWTFGNNVLLVPGTTYDIWVQDDDAIASGIPGPEDCGHVFFSADTSANTFTLTSGQLSVTVNLTRSTSFLRDTISTTDFVIVNDCTSISEVERIESSFNVFPNPTSGEVQVQFVMPATQNQEVSLKISDMLGRTLSQEQLGNFSGNYNGSLDLKAFGPGVYMLQLQVGNELLYKKVIVR